MEKLFDVISDNLFFEMAINILEEKLKLTSNEYELNNYRYGNKEKNEFEYWLTVGEYALYFSYDVDTKKELLNVWNLDTVIEDDRTLIFGVNEVTNNAIMKALRKHNFLIDESLKKL